MRVVFLRDIMMKVRDVLITLRDRTKGGGRDWNLSGLLDIEYMQRLLRVSDDRYVYLYLYFIKYQFRREEGKFQKAKQKDLINEIYRKKMQIRSVYGMQYSICTSLDYTKPNPVLFHKTW